MLTLDELKKKFDKAYNINQVTRDKSANDLIFYWVTQWDDNILDTTQLAYRGEFNIMRKGGRQIMNEMRANPVQPDFHPKDEDRQDDAEIMDGFYRAVDRELSSETAYNYAMQDQVVCGFGAWRLYTEWKTNAVGDQRQVIKREYIPQANNTVFFDPNDNSPSKDNSQYCAVLYTYSEDGYKDLVEDLTGERPEVKGSNFKNPDRDVGFVWYSSNEEIYVVRFYQIEKFKDKVLFIEDPLGETFVHYESDIKDQLDELIDGGFSIINEKTIRRDRVREYIASGQEILNGRMNSKTGERMGEVIVGDQIPIVPLYGEHVPNLQGQEYWEGITRLAKDPQRLRNFQMSYLADLLSQSPRRKPIFFPEQIQGFEQMYDISGIDNNYPYLLQQRKTPNGEDLPIGPVAEMPEPTVPPALIAGIDQTRQAVEDIINPALPQNLADPDLSGKAVNALQKQIDLQTYHYQHNLKLAKRRDALIFAGIASSVMDVPQQITVRAPDGATESVQLMRNIYDEETGEIRTINDITNMEFDVYTDIGPSYETQKEQTLERLTAMYQSMAEGEPEKRYLMLQILQLTDGVEMEGLRDFARKQAILSGFTEPETDEEKEMVAAQAQNQQPDANMVLAMAEQQKAQADQAEVQRKAQKDFIDAQINAAKIQLDEKRLNIEEAKAQVDAAQAGVNVQKILADTRSVNIDNQVKVLGGIGA